MMEKQAEEKLDSYYFEKLNSVFEDEPTLPVALRPKNLGKEKKRFSHTHENPKFSYDVISDKEYSVGEKTFNSLAKELKSEKNSALKKLYLAKIEELSRQLELRKAIGSDSESFHRESVWLFSKPGSKDIKVALRDFQEELELKQIKKESRKKHDSAIIKKAMNRAIKMWGISEWKALIESSATNIITLNPKHKKGRVVEIPRDRCADLFEIEGLVNHEIGTHLVRGFNGAASPLQLLAFMGADKYASTEEGLATFAEQRLAIERNMIPKSAGVRATLSIGAALEGRNFKDTYQFLLSIGFDHRDAWKYTFRTFRGVGDTAKRKGKILTFDWRYREGNQAIWGLVEKYGENILSRLWVGKIGIHHLSLMKQLGITKPTIQRKYLKIEEILPELAKKTC